MRIPPAMAAVLAGWAGAMASCPGAAGEPAQQLIVPWGLTTFVPEEGCRWQRPAAALEGLPHNAHYLASPRPGQDWDRWLTALRTYRDAVRKGLHDPAQAQILLRFDGVRAWVRTDRRWAWAADLAPGETVLVRGEVRPLAGNGTLCLALDWCDRSQQDQGPWRGWSTVIGSSSSPDDGDWQRFEISARVPPFDFAKCWARPILGMDGTFDARPGSVLLRNLSLSLPHSPARRERLQALKPPPDRPAGFDDSLYCRADLGWMTRNFVCGFLFVYDRSFWDPQKRQYRVGPLCEEVQREFGAYDSVVLWHAYPRIGADERNQFDFFRDMPGGLEGVRNVVRQFHHRGVKVFVPYNPWDTGTAREKDSDEQALARLVAALEADGIFLDTMIAAPAGLRQAVDAVRPGVAFEPEGHPAIDEMEICSGSWAQGLQAFPEIGVLHLKWLEPRHMQHQIRRWDRSHQQELAAAWLNGSGILVWENIFGTWNPWNAEDRATLRRMAPVLRHFADLLAEGQWRPYYPTQAENVYASCWESSGVRLWTLVNLSGRAVEGPILELEDENQPFFDLWRGSPLQPARVGDKLRLSLPLERFGVVAALPKDGPDASLASLIERQRQESQRPVPRPDNDPHVPARPVIDPRPAPACAGAGPAQTAGMLKCPAAAATFTVRHMRRECGCYPDPGTPPEQWQRFLTGNPHNSTLEHRVPVKLGSYWIDAKPVTNAEFEAFLKATGYTPRCRDKFLHHWGGPTCPPAARDTPVVYVDLEDARAYAAWAKRRLPTEWEWQHAAAQHGDAFQRDEVFEWTESQRDDGHTRFVMLRGGCRHQAKGSIWYFPGGPQPIESHAKFILMDSGLDRCSTVGFRCVAPE